MITGPELRSRLSFWVVEVRRVNLFAAPLDILRIKPGPLLGFGIMVSAGEEVLMVAGTAMALSPSSREGEDVGGSGIFRPRSESAADRKGVPEGLESFDGLEEGCREFEVDEYAEVYVGAGAGGTDDGEVKTCCSLGLGPEAASFKLAGVSPCTAEGGEVAA